MIQTIIVKPLITEKSLSLAPRGWFSFAVAEKARKNQIAGAIEKQYKVNVIGVRTSMMPAKTRKAGRSGRTIHVMQWKKALVQLKSGQHIDAFEISEEPKKG